MPLYKYKCENCENVEELFCSYASKQDKEKNLVCSKCSGKEFSPIFTKVTVSSDRKSIPESSCSSCNSGSCNTCGM